MSLVVFPFKSEPTSLIAANLAIATAHERVSEVWAVAAEEDQVMRSVEPIAVSISATHGKPVSVFAQNRIGTFRSGKGDAINTALKKAREIGFERVHFYDADITNFDHSWIDGAEQKGDDGYEVVRHRFPRAATDAMITWMITRPALAMLFPGSALARIGQPLGGELMLSDRTVVEMVKDPLVTARSDWGIDTVLTYSTAMSARPLYEHHVASGKRHALYGALDELRTMVVECLDAVSSLAGLPDPGPDLDADAPSPVPDDLKRIVGYDRDRTTRLLATGWTPDEIDLARELPDVGVEVLVNRERPNFGFMNGATWGMTLKHLLRNFRLGDPAWEALAFRLWLMRVLAYTTAHASQGYDHAIDYLEETIRGYESS